MRAGRVASGRSGTLRVGFTENASWRGVVPDSFRRFRELQPDAELQLQPAGSLEQLEAIRSGRLDAGFVFNMPKSDPELDQLLVAVQHIELAAPKGHPLTKLKKLRLRDLTDAHVCLVSKAGKPGVVRSPDARMLSRRFEVSPHRSGGIKRGNDPKSRSDRLGCGMGPWNGTLAVSKKCRHHVRGRPEPATAVGSRVEKGQCVPFARELHRRCAAFARTCERCTKADTNLFCARFLPSRTIVLPCAMDLSMMTGHAGFFSDRFQCATRSFLSDSRLENQLTERQLMPLMRWCRC